MTSVAAPIACKRIPTEQYLVVVGPKPGQFHTCICLYVVPTLLIVLSPIFLLGIFLIMKQCHRVPEIALEDLTIHNMTIHNLTTSSTPINSPWQVDIALNVTLSMRNKNTVAGCWTKFQHTVVWVEYKGHLLLQHEVPLFNLKVSSRRSRISSVQITGNRLQVTKDLGTDLQGNLRGDQEMDLQFSFDTTYRRSDSKRARLNQIECLVAAKTPLLSSEFGNNTLWKYCTNYQRS